MSSLISPDQPLTLEGEALAEATIRVFLQKGDKEPIVKEAYSDSEGKWNLSLLEALEKGNYKIWIEAEDKRGAKSLATDVQNLEVGLSPFLKFGTIAISYLAIMSALIVLIAILVLAVAYAWYRISLWRRRLRAETKDVSQTFQAAFRALREEVQEQVENLDGKQGLSAAEKRVRDRLKEALDVSEKFVEKELKDVEKELE